MSRLASRPPGLLSFPGRLGWRLALLASFSVPAPARASVPACDDARIRIEGPLEPSWARAVLALCESLPELPDLDPQIVIRVISYRAGIILEASLPDGRTTLRRIQAPADLRPTLEALATVPPEPPPLPARDPPAAGPAPSVAPPQPPVTLRGPPDPPVVPVSHRGGPSLGFELAASADVRLEGSPSYVSAGPSAYVGIRPGPWMLALTVRWQVAQTVVHAPPQGFEMGTFAFGFATARRFAWTPAVHVDLGLSTMLLVQRQEYLPHGGDEDDELESTTVDARIGPLVRLIVGRGAWRLLLSLDGDFSPIRIGHPRRIDGEAPPLPTFGVGLNTGFCWGWADP